MKSIFIVMRIDLNLLVELHSQYVIISVRKCVWLDFNGIINAYCLASAVLRLIESQNSIRKFLAAMYYKNQGQESRKRQIFRNNRAEEKEKKGWEKMSLAPGE